MKRTEAAFTILIGLVAVMIGLYTIEYKTLADILQRHVMLFP